MFKVSVCGAGTNMDTLVSQEFGIGEIVWAKMKFYPHWPALIINPLSFDTVKKSQKYVLFFGGKEHAWISDKNLFSFAENFKKFSKPTKVNFRIALAAVKKYTKNIEKYKKYQRPSRQKIEVLKKVLCLSSDEARKDLMNKNALKTPIKKDTDNNTTALLQPAPPYSNIALEIKSEVTDEESVATDQILTQPVISSVGCAKDIFSMHNFPADILQEESDEKLDVNTRIPDSTPDINFFEKSPCVTSDYDGCTPVKKSKLFSIKNCNSEISFMPAGEGPSTSTKTCCCEKVNGEDITCENLIRKGHRPYAMKIGIIGIGRLGTHLSEMLINRGHTINIWNPSWKSDYARIVRSGSRYCRNPEEVVRLSDMIFCTLEDDDVVKRVIRGDDFNEHYALKGLGGSEKSFVMLTPILPELSKQLSEAITGRGTSYLQACVLPKIMDLFLICSGDISVYHKLSECLCCTGTVLYRISSQVGDALLMNQAYSMSDIGALSSVNEVMAFHKCCNIKFEDFLTIVKETKALQLVLHRFDGINFNLTISHT